MVIHGRDSAAADEVRSEIEALGRTANVVLGDLNGRAAVQDVVREAYAAAGEIDILINNAGACVHRPALDVTDDEWAHVIDTNLTALWRMSQEVGAHMVARKKGSIVNIGSISGMIVNRPQMQPAYNASKAAVHQLTKSLAAEWAPPVFESTLWRPGTSRPTCPRSTTPSSGATGSRTHPSSATPYRRKSAPLSSSWRLTPQAS